MTISQRTTDEPVPLGAIIRELLEVIDRLVGERDCARAAAFTWWCRGWSAGYRERKRRRAS
jgi:hypothetical protein